MSGDARELWIEALAKAIRERRWPYSGVRNLDSAARVALVAAEWAAEAMRVARDEAMSLESEIGYADPLPWDAARAAMAREEKGDG